LGAQMDQIAQKLNATPSIHKRAHEYVVGRLPKFIYMSDYRAFEGSALLDQVKQRRDTKRSTEQDKTLLMIMELSGLDLDEVVQKGGGQDREQRTYDLDDASETLTSTISDRWKQRRYEVQLRADGQHFSTYVKDDRDPSLIRLDERSKGFQWFFSFDLLFMFESGGTFQNCVLLLDEPGLHLHPDAQRDLLKRLEAYATGNTLIYTTHLPFMIDLRHPDRIRVVNEGEEGTTVGSDLSGSQPESKFVLQAALGMSGSMSFLVAQRNLVVEGVDDYWIITELSNILLRSDETGLPDDLMITPAGGASEAVYVATFMIGQRLEVVVLLDTDQAGARARDALIKSWIARYHGAPSQVLNLAQALGETEHEFAIEDLLSEDYYLERVQRTYSKQLAAAGITSITLSGGGTLRKRVQRAFDAIGIPFNRGIVAKSIRADLAHAKDVAHLPAELTSRARKLMAAIRGAFPKGSNTLP
jgi:predicted ATP-dependent endonuclease of OLD family